MSGVGFWELILVFLIGLIVLGPERLPRVASQLGTWLGQARRMTRLMKRQLEDELNLEKEMTVRPRPRPPSTLPPPTTAKRQEEFDDTYSPAHDANDVGTELRDANSPAHDANDVSTGPVDVNTVDDDQNVDAVSGTDVDAEKESGDSSVPQKTT